MFDFAWSELALIAVVAMIAIGPKDMPAAIRAVTGWVKKARRMAAEFQTHVDEMVREADLSEVRASINEIRDFDFRSRSRRRSMRTARSVPRSRLIRWRRAPSTVTSVEEIAVSEPAVEAIAPPEEPAVAATPCKPPAPAFVPPNLVHPVALADTGEPEPPAFIPPDVAQQRRARPSA